MRVEATADEGFVNTNQDPAFRDARAMTTSSDGVGPTNWRWVFTRTFSPGIRSRILRAGGSRIQEQDVWRSRRQLHCNKPLAQWLQALCRDSKGAFGGIEKRFGTVQRACGRRRSSAPAHRYLGPESFVHVSGFLHGGQYEARLQAFTPQAQCLTHGVKCRFPAVDSDRDFDESTPEQNGAVRLRTVSPFLAAKWITEWP